MFSKFFICFFTSILLSSCFAAKSQSTNPGAEKSETENLFLKIQDIPSAAEEEGPILKIASVKGVSVQANCKATSKQVVFLKLKISRLLFPDNFSFYGKLQSMNISFKPLEISESEFQSLCNN